MKITNKTSTLPRFHEISNTSLEELKSYYYLSYDLRYISKTEGEQLINLSRQVGGMLNCLNSSL